MMRRIFKALSFVVLSAALFCSTLCIASTSAYAEVSGVTTPSEESSSLELNGDFDREQSIHDMNLDDLFGPEQVFPFEPGLGNQSGAIRGITGGPGAY